MYKCKEFVKVNRMTQNQIKKHISQMNKLEKDLVNLAVKKFNVDKMIISPHLKEKMETQGITYDLDRIKEVIRNFDLDKNLIEVNYNFDESTRIAIKDTKPVEVNVGGKVEKCVICFVFNLKNGHLVTVYWNSIEYSKRIPNLNRYCKNYNMAKHLKQYI